MKANKNKNKKLAIKLTLRISLALLVVFAILIAVIASFLHAGLAKRELEKLELLAGENVRIASYFMETMMNKQHVIITAMQMLEQMPIQTRVTYMEELLEEVGKGQEGILSLFYIGHPNSMLPNTPNGFSIFASESGVFSQEDMFTYVNEASYREMEKSKATYIADPFEKEIDGKVYMVISVLVPILDDAGAVVGAVGSNIDTQVLSDAQYNTGGYDTFNNEIICGHKTVITNSRDAATIGRAFADVSVSKDPERILEAAQNAQRIVFLDTAKDGTKHYRAFVPFYLDNSTTPWLSGSSITQSEFNKNIISQVILISLVALAGLIVLILFVFTMMRRTLKPLKDIEQAMHQMAMANLKARLEYQSDDEMGRVVASINESMETTAFYVEDMNRAMKEMANGNFDVYPTKPFIGDFSGFESAMTNFIKNMCFTLDRIEKSAVLVANTADQVSGGAEILSHGAAEQSGSVEELNSAISALSGQVKQNNEVAVIAGNYVQEAAQHLGESADHMKDMTKAMDRITGSSAEIAKIIKTIEDIAFQTNILALNAAVEAARAGSAGKGFAVVADEVRNLAGKSAEAAKNTTELLKNTIESIEDGGAISKKAASSLAIVKEKAEAVVSIVEEIQKSSKEQMQEIEIVSAGANQIADVVNTNSATAEESAASSEEMAAQAQILKNLTNQFQLNKMLMKEFD